MAFCQKCYYTAWLMAKLWQKNYDIHELLERFTVGEDYLIDRQLVGADCAGSLAHARMLHKQGYLSADDLAVLELALREIFACFTAGEIEIRPAQEDCHTAIEEMLVESVGDAGRRIHLGRSRNDQSLTAIRLYGREYLLEIQGALFALIETMLAFSDTHSAVPMPGRTHTQIAMPSSVGLWSAAFAEDLLDASCCLTTAFDLFNRSPLGSAAGYGLPLNIDREYSATLMGFPAVQNNVLAVQNSRGKLEAIVCDALDQIAMVFSKVGQDMILFSLPEFSYFSLPDELCTGSSIMPQKKNPDGLELLRSRSASIAGWTSQIKQIIRSLPSGYNRDFQDTKEPFFRCLQTILPSIQLIELTFTKLTVNEAALRSAHSPEIFATDEAIRLVEEGMPFRDAYRQVGSQLDKLVAYDLDQVLSTRRSSGYPANLGLHLISERLKDYRRDHASHRDRHYQALRGLLGEGAQLVKGLARP